MTRIIREDLIFFILLSTTAHDASMRARRAAYARAHARIVAPHSLVSLSAALSPRSFTSLALGGSRALARAHEQVVAQLIIYHPRTRARALASLSAALSPPLARLALRRISRISARPQTNKQVVAQIIIQSSLS